MSLNIIGMGYSHPSQELDNNFLEGLNVGTNAQWISEKIGIQTRVTTLSPDYIDKTRNADPEEAIKVATKSPTDLAVAAAEMAIKRAGIKADQIGLVICNCCTPVQMSPTEAVRISARLGIEARAYDLFTACPAFALCLDYLSNFRSEELPEFVLCVSTATLTQNVNYNDRSDGAIWGDGAAAWIVSARHPGKLKVIETSYSTDATRCDAVVVERYGHFHQDGRAVRDFSVRQTVRLIKAVEERHKMDWTRDIFIGHQANATIQ